MADNNEMKISTAFEQENQGATTTLPMAASGVLKRMMKVAVPATGVAAATGLGMAYSQPKHGFNGEIVPLCDKGYMSVFSKGIPWPAFWDEKEVEELRNNFKLRGGEKGDIVIATYPKAGTTWAQQIVLTLLAGGDPTPVTDPMDMAPWFERAVSVNIGPQVNVPGDTHLERFTNWEQPETFGGRRVFKTHSVCKDSPWVGAGSAEGIPKGAKVIVVTRNPKDVAVSLFHHTCNIPIFKFTGDLSYFLKTLFLPGTVEAGNFWAWHGGWLKASKELPDDRILWVAFEDLKADRAGEIKRIADFCNIKADEDIIASTVVGSSFQHMKKNQEIVDARKIAAGSRIKFNHFRKGTKGGWKNRFNEEEKAEFDKVHERESKKYKIPADFWTFQ